MINLHERMLPTSAGVEPATSWSPVGRRIQLSHRGHSQQLRWPYILLSVIVNKEDNLLVTSSLLSSTQRTCCNGLHSDRKQFCPSVSFNPFMPTSHNRDIGKQCRLRSDAATCGVWSESILFTLATGISVNNYKSETGTSYIGNEPVRRVNVFEFIRHK